MKSHRLFAAFALAALSIAPLAPAGVVPLPTPLTITADNTYTYPTDRGQSYNLNLKGTFAGATVSLQYFNPSGQTWDELQSFTAPLTGFLHLAGNNEARLVVTGSTGSTSIATELYAAAPLTAFKPTISSDGTAATVVQERDGVPQIDTLAALNAVSPTRDCTGFRSIMVQPTAIGVGGQYIAEVSNDGTNWTATAGYQPGNTGNGAPIASAFAPVVGAAYQFPTPGRYFRLRLSSWTSGSFVFNSFLRSEPMPKLGEYIGGGATGTAALNIQGHQAGNAAAGGNPLRISGLAKTANSTTYGNGTNADFTATQFGALIQKPYSIPEADWSYVPPAGGLANSATAVSIKAAAGAGLRNYITSMILSADTLGAACDIVVLDGSTVIFRHRLQTTGLPAGLNLDFPTPLKSTANTALSIQTQVGGTSTAVTGGIYADVQGYAAP